MAMESAWPGDLPVRRGTRGPGPVRLGWIGFAVVATLVCGALVMALGVGPRTDADVLPRQLSHDAATRLAQGASPGSVLPTTIDIERDTGAFVIVFDNAGHPVASSATLGGAVPVPPPGVFGHVDQQGSDTITWQPAAGLREAAVITRIGPGGRGYVLAARPLGDISSRELLVNSVVFVAWLLLMAAAAAGFLANSRR